MVLGMAGRPSKGDRYAARTSLPRPVADAVWAMHDQTGAAVNDIIARFVALALNMPEYAPPLPPPLIADVAVLRRPSKGDHYAAKSRLPREVADRVWAIHHQTGEPMSGIIARFVALGLNMPDQVPPYSAVPSQEALELRTA